MDDFIAIEYLLRRSEELRKEAEMARAYINITAEHGPSAQLIAFVNHDKSLGSEIGLEAFDTFSTQTQHEILMSQLKPDVLDQMAIESFRDFIKKYRTALTIGGILVPFAGWPMLIAGISGFVINSKDKKAPCPQFKYFEKAKDLYESSFNKVNGLVGKIPGGFLEKDWEAFSKLCSAADVRDKVSEYKEPEDIEFERSGWTEPTFSDAITYLRNAVAKVEELEKHVADKLTGSEHFLQNAEDEEKKNVEKHITSGVKALSDNLKGLSTALRHVNDIVKDASKHFSAKKEEK